MRLNSDIESQNIEGLNFLVNQAKNKIEYCEKQYKTVDSRLVELQDQLETARGNIEETYQSYKAILEKRRVSEVIYFFSFKNLTI